MAAFVRYEYRVDTYWPVTDVPIVGRTEEGIIIFTSKEAVTSGDIVKWPVSWKSGYLLVLRRARFSCELW